MPVGRCLLAAFLVLGVVISARATTDDLFPADHSICYDDVSKPAGYAEVDRGQMALASSSTNVISLGEGARESIRE